MLDSCDDDDDDGDNYDDNDDGDGGGMRDFILFFFQPYLVSNLLLIYF